MSLNQVIGLTVLAYCICAILLVVFNVKVGDLDVGLFMIYVFFLFLVFCSVAWISEGIRKDLDDGGCNSRE